MPFPTTPVLDDAERADENPLSDGGNWNGPIRGNLELLKIVSNQFAHHDGAGAQGAMWWTPEQFTRPLEVHVEIPVLSGVAGVYYCISNAPPDTTNVDFYSWQWQTSTTMRLYEVLNGVFTQVGSDYAITLASGDAIGVYLDENGIHNLYHKPSAGSWTLIDSVDDDTFTSGFIGMTCGANATVRLDNFGGGEVVEKQSFFMSRRRAWR